MQLSGGWAAWCWPGEPRRQKAHEVYTMFCLDIELLMDEGFSMLLHSSLDFAHAGADESDTPFIQRMAIKPLKQSALWN